MPKKDKLAKWRELEPHMKYITDFMCMIAKRKNTALWIQRIISTRKNGSIRHMIDSMAAINAIIKIKKRIGNNFDFNDMVIYSVADGVKPYTAIILALYFPNTEIHCIDPYVRQHTKHSLMYNMNNITLHKKKIEDVDIKSNKKISVIVSVHGHGPISEFYAQLSKPKYFVSIPCCKDYGKIKDRDADIEYIDQNIVCECNKILVYIDI